MESIARSGIITFLSDFGLDDAYVGIVKGVILSVFPRAIIIDITHNIKPQSISEASYLLFTSAPYFPPGTVHLAVVDPGVGTSRRPILVQTREQFLVGPDNGLFTDFINDDAKIFHLNRPEFFLNHISQTFHARDIFAPVSAHLASGVSPEKMGEPISNPCLLNRPKPEIKPDRIIGQVIHIDRFGDLITNIPQKLVPENAIIRIMGKEISGLSKNYCGPSGTLLALIGSSGLLEISIASDSASLRLKAGVGQPVEVIFAQS